MNFKKAVLVTLIFFIVSLILNMSDTLASESASGNSAGHPDSISVGIRVDLPPYAFINEYGRADGFSVELLNSASSLMGLTLDIRMGPIEKLKESLLNGDIDILVGLEYTEENARHAMFGQPHTIIYDAIFFQENGPEFEEMADLKKRRVVVLENDIAQHYLTVNKITDNIRTVETVAEALKAVAGGKAEAALVPLHSAQIIIDSYNLSGLDHSQYPVSDYHRTLAFAGSKKAGEQLSLLEQGLSLMRTNGAYDRVYSRWLGKNGPAEFGNTRVIRYALIAGLILTALLAGILAWAMYLRRKIALRTRVLAREINNREVTGEELKTYRNRMEELVEHRTAVLKENAERFRKELDEARSVNRTLEGERDGYRRTLEFSRIAPWSYDIDRGTVSWDKRVFEFFGLDAEDYKPSLEKFVDLFDKYDSARFRTALDRTANTGERFELVLKRVADGPESTALQINGAGVTDGVGRVCRIEGTLLDISERDAIERDWREAYDEWDELFDNNTVPMIILNRDLIVTDFNRAAGQNLDCELGSVVGKHFFESAFPYLKGSAVEKSIQRTFDDETPVSLEYHLTENSKDEWFEIAISPFRNGLTVSFFDITGEKETERKLNDRESRVASLSKNIETLKGNEERLNRINHFIGSMKRLTGLMHEYDNPQRLLESTAEYLRDNLNFTEIRMTLLDRNLKPEYRSIDGISCSDEVAGKIKNSRELPKCCKSLLFTNDAVHRVNPAEDCHECELKSVNCTDGTLVASIKSSDRFRGFVQLSEEWFGEESELAAELTETLAGDLTRALENIDATERYERKLRIYRSGEETLGQLADLFSDIKRTNAEVLIRDGIMMLTKSVNADLGFIVSLHADKPLLLNEWHENGFDIKTEWFGVLEASALERISLYDRANVSENADSVSNEINRVLADNLGMRATAIFPLKKSDRTIAVLILSSENDETFAKPEKLGYLKAAANIFASAVSTLHEFDLSRVIRNELRAFIDYLTDTNSAEFPDIPKFLFDPPHDISDSDSDLDQRFATIDMNHLIDEILSDSYYLARNKNITLVREMDLPPADGVHETAQSLFRQIINGIVEKSTYERRSVVEIGYDHYVLSPDGKMGGYFIKYSDCNLPFESILQASEGISGKDIEIYEVGDGDEYHRVIVSLPFVFSNSLVVSENRALVQI